MLYSVELPRESVKMEPLRRSERLMMKRDKLSDLPNAILLHVMSFMMLKDAVKTCVLSKRWKNLWKSLPDLTLHTSEFSKPWYFAEFVSGIVSCRKGNHPLRTLDFDRHGYLQSQIITDLINYALFQSVQNLKIYVPYNLGLPCSVFSCHTLTSLDISVSMYDVKRRTRVPKYLDLPALRSFRLEGVGISADNNGHAEPFSTLNKLNTLSIDNCVLIYPNSLSPDVLGILNITNATLVNLTINNTLGLNYKTKVPDPGHKYAISTPKLSSFTLNGSPFQTAAVPEWVEIEL